MEKDYKAILDSVIGCLDNNGLPVVMSNEDVPFEYCEKVLNKKGASWQTIASIILRSDCPEDVFVKYCKRRGEKFALTLVNSGKEIPEKALDVILMNKGNLYPILQYWKLPDSMKRKILEGMRDKKCGMAAHFETFIQKQISIPDDCWGIVDELASTLLKTNTYYNTNYNPLLFLLPMRIPLDEDATLKMLESDERGFVLRRMNYILKLAANPSISDYGIMELRLKFSDDFNRNDIEWVLNKYKERREKWRSERMEKGE